MKNEVKATNSGDKTPAAFWRTFGVPHGLGLFPLGTSWILRLCRSKLKVLMETAEKQSQETKICIQDLPEREVLPHKPGSWQRILGVRDESE